MPQLALPPQHVPDLSEDVILGVDTRKDIHMAASLAHQEFPTTVVGYRQLFAWAWSFGILRRAGVECTGSYGATTTPKSADSPAGDMRVVRLAKESTVRARTRAMN
jgi:transposase